ncbi:lysophospholipid acyltransferase family protein [soil metagenome]
MGWLRTAARAVLIAVQALVGLLTLFLLFPFMKVATRDRISSAYLRVLLRVCGVQARVHGAPLPRDHGELVVSNHVSWLDVMALHTLGPVAFVSKSEVRDWPVIGVLAERSGTLFIERGRRRAVHAVIEAIAARLGQRRHCVVFAEGTTGDGSAVLPFHSNLLKAALEARTPLRPVVVVYRHEGRLSRLAAYDGDMSLLDSLRLVLPARRISVDVIALEAIEPAPDETRHHLAERVHAVIAAAHRQELERP